MFGRWRFGVWWISLWVLNISFAVAASPELLVTPLSSQTPTQTPTPKVSKTPRKKFREQKETDGTEAPGRFEGNTILKSEYHLDGQPLEVDPD